MQAIGLSASCDNARQGAATCARSPASPWNSLPSHFVCCRQVTFLKITNVAQRKTGRRYLRTFAGLAAAGRLDLSSDLDLAEEDEEEGADGPAVVQWALPNEDFSV